MSKGGIALVVGAALALHAIADLVFGVSDAVLRFLVTAPFVMLIAWLRFRLSERKRGPRC